MGGLVVDGLSHGGQRRVAVGGDLEAVEPDDRDVLGHSGTGPAQAGDYSHGQNIARGEHARHAPLPRTGSRHPSAQFSAGAHSGGEVHLRPDHLRGVHSPAPGGAGEQSVFQAVESGLDHGRAEADRTDEGDAPVAQAREALSDASGTASVVDIDRAENLPARRDHLRTVGIDEDDGRLRPGQPRMYRRRNRAEADHAADPPGPQAVDHLIGAVGVRPAEHEGVPRPAGGALACADEGGLMAGGQGGQAVTGAVDQRDDARGGAGQGASLGIGDVAEGLDGPPYAFPGGRRHLMLAPVDDIGDGHGAHAGEGCDIAQSRHARPSSED